MNIISFIDKTAFLVGKSDGDHPAVFQPGIPYVISDMLIHGVIKDLAKSASAISVYDNRIKPFKLGDRCGGVERLIYYNGSGGIGDQVFSWPVVKALSDLGYRVSVLVDTGMEYIWENFPFVNSIISTPAPLEIVEMFPHKVIFQSLVNQDRHKDQMHPTDLQFYKLGIDPVKMGIEYMSIPPMFSKMENEHFEKAFSNLNYIVFQPCSSSLTRNLTGKNIKDILEGILEEFTGLYIYVLHDRFYSTDIIDMLHSINDPRIKLTNLANIREIWGLISKARACIGPDSMGIHIAGSMGVPSIGLWGPIPYKSRTKYIKNHYPIYKEHKCSYAPCYVSANEFPILCSSQSSPRSVCEVLKDIPTKEVTTILKNILETQKR